MCHLFPSTLVSFLRPRLFLRLFFPPFTFPSWLLEAHLSCTSYRPGNFDDFPLRRLRSDTSFCGATQNSLIPDFWLAPPCEISAVVIWVAELFERFYGERLKGRVPDSCKNCALPRQTNIVCCSSPFICDYSLLISKAGIYLIQLIIQSISSF